MIVQSPEPGAHFKNALLHANIYIENIEKIMSTKYMEDESRI